MKGYLGINVGLNDIKWVVIMDNKDIVAMKKVKIKGKNMLNTIIDLLNNIKKTLKNTDIKIVGVGVTGYNRNIIGNYIGANLIKNEISSIVSGIINMYKDAKYILDIGKYDTKLITLDGNKIIDIKTNVIATTNIGDFIEKQAHNLNLMMDDINDIDTKYEIYDKYYHDLKCINSDLILDIDKNDTDMLFSSLYHDICDNFINYIIKDIDKSKKIILIGGVALNKNILNILKNKYKLNIETSIYPEFVSALGAAILSESKEEISFYYNKYFIKEERIPR